MLECGSNYKGTMKEICNECQTIDNEDHRINNCPKWEYVNFCNDKCKINFDDIYSDNYERCLEVVESILRMWDLENGKNEMRRK